MTLAQAKKITKKSKYIKSGNKPDSNFLKAYALLTLAEKEIGWKSLTYYFVRYQNYEHEESGYKVKHTNP